MSVRRWIAVAVLSSVLLVAMRSVVAADEPIECFPWPVGCAIDTN
jgi:hypothetical protein